MEEKSVLIIFWENEGNIKKLYEIYSNKFPLNEKLWSRLIKEEEGHANLLGSLIKKTKQIDGFLKLNEYSMPIVERINDFVQQEITRAQSEDITEIDALETALRLEQSMIEKKCFEMFEPGNREIEKVFNKLNSDTDQHARAIEKAYKKEINKSIHGSKG